MEKTKIVGKLVGGGFMAGVRALSCLVLLVGMVMAWRVGLVQAVVEDYQVTCVRRTLEPGEVREIVGSVEDVFVSYEECERAAGGSGQGLSSSQISDLSNARCSSTGDYECVGENKYYCPYSGATWIKTGTCTQEDRDAQSRYQQTVDEIQNNVQRVIDRLSPGTRVDRVIDISTWPVCGGYGVDGTYYESGDCLYGAECVTDTWIMAQVGTACYGSRSGGVISGGDDLSDRDEVVDEVDTDWDLALYTPICEEGEELSVFGVCYVPNCIGDGQQCWYGECKCGNGEVGLGETCDSGFEYCGYQEPVRVAQGARSSCGGVGATHGTCELGAKCDETTGEWLIDSDCDYSRLYRHEVGDRIVVGERACPVNAVRCECTEVTGDIYTERAGHATIGPGASCINGYEISGVYLDTGQSYNTDVSYEIDEGLYGFYNWVERTEAIVEGVGEVPVGDLAVAATYQVLDLLTGGMSHDEELNEWAEDWRTRTGVLIENADQMGVGEVLAAGVFQIADALTAGLSQREGVQMWRERTEAIGDNWDDLTIWQRIGVIGFQVGDAISMGQLWQTAESYEFARQQCDAGDPNCELHYVGGGLNLLLAGIDLVGTGAMISPAVGDVAGGVLGRVGDLASGAVGRVGDVATSLTGVTQADVVYGWRRFVYDVLDIPPYVYESGGSAPVDMLSILNQVDEAAPVRGQLIFPGDDAVQDVSRALVPLEQTAQGARYVPTDVVGVQYLADDAYEGVARSNVLNIRGLRDQVQSAMELADEIAQVENAGGIVDRTTRLLYENAISGVNRGLRDFPFPVYTDDLIGLNDQLWGLMRMQMQTYEQSRVLAQDYGILWHEADDALRFASVNYPGVPIEDALESALLYLRSMEQ